MTWPRAARLPRARRRSASRTRAHSVTTWRARRRSTASDSSLRSLELAQAEGAAELLGGPLALGPPGGVGRGHEQSGRLAVHDDEGRLLGHHDRVGARACGSRCASAWSAVAPAMASGSSRPTCAPVARSASCSVRARARGSGSCPRASSSATEKAALDERPAPTGTVLVTSIRPPAPPGGGQRRRSPAARRASGGRG